MSAEDKIHWSDAELNELLKMNRSQDENETSFLIPPIVFQLKGFHPNCTKPIDAERFDKLISLYLKVRHKDVSSLENKTLAEKLIFIREDYYNQLQDERLLPHMRYTMDDGPLYGEIPKSIPESKLSESISTDFGKLSIVTANNQIFLTATDKKNKTIWSRIMKGANPDRKLKNLNFDESPVEKTSLSIIIHFYSEGERLNLYLKLDGKFMYYYHSW
ncbi:MAG: hypothetical protein LH614_03320 [Pyrinomonadaceae bacterium]|nr:hypothetical protein [Pyrinomonadaceae bacterium]